jgi:hypothetical protein
MMLEDIDPGAWLSREVYAWFGLAMYSSQVPVRNWSHDREEDFPQLKK